MHEILCQPSIDNLSDLLDNSEYRYLLPLKTDYGARLIDIPDNRYFECPDCQTLHSALHLKVQYDGNKVYTKKQPCDPCGSRLKPRFAR